MMDLTTPALLFPAISLLLLAYSQRFLVIAQLIRQLHHTDEEKLGEMVVRQIDNLRFRIVLIQRMQLCGVMSFLACTVSMFCLFLQQVTVGEYVFGGSLVLLSLSLLFSLQEIYLSCGAIDVELSEIEKQR